jgi:nucleoside-diphosphate-sugar epimerase
VTSPRLTLITGGAGFVGRRLVHALRDDRPLRCPVRSHEDLDAGDGVEVVTGDLADRDGLTALAVR